jgi:hypothetical protein
MKEFIDLGCGLDSPSSPMTASESPKKSYPCFYFTCDEKIDLPDGDFTFTAKGRKIESSENTRDPEEPRYRYEIEVHGFKPMGGAKKESPDMGSEFRKNLDRKMMEGE